MLVSIFSKASAHTSRVAREPGEESRQSPLDPSVPKPPSPDVDLPLCLLPDTRACRGVLAGSVIAHIVLIAGLFVASVLFGSIPPLHVATVIKIFHGDPARLIAPAGGSRQAALPAPIKRHVHRPFAVTLPRPLEAPKIVEPPPVRQVVRPADEPNILAEVIVPPPPRPVLDVAPTKNPAGPAEGQGGSSNGPGGPGGGLGGTKPPLELKPSSPPPAPKHKPAVPQVADLTPQSRQPTPPPKPPVEQPAVTKPYITFMPTPLYPAAALEDGIEGDVVVEVTFERDGHVLFQRYTHHIRPDLDDAARAAVLQIKFQPARMGDVPVNHLAQVTVMFRLTSKQTITTQFLGGFEL